MSAIHPLRTSAAVSYASVMPGNLLIRTAKLTARLLVFSLVGEVLFQAAYRLLIGSHPVLFFFFYAAMSAALLPFIPFALALEVQGQRIRNGQRFGIALALLGVVCANAVLVSLVNGIGWSVGDVSLGVLPAWYVVILATLALFRWRRWSH